ncbi:MAG: hypothetical protein CUN55_07305 [Phototrophicales bacterium]|nr:MAG: hypothetical protein CUN55_07305 [Phototrophicales bacterium]
METQQASITTSLQYFTEHDLAVLTLICDTLIPSLDTDTERYGLYKRKASDLNIPQLLAQAIESVAEPSAIQELRAFLSAIESPFINMLLVRKALKFSEMNAAQRIELLHSWETSRFNLRRKAFQAVKRLALMLFYSVTDPQTKRNPNWEAIGYSGPPPNPQKQKTTIRPLSITEDTVLYTDAVIVGSGAGGGVVAGELSAAGWDVIVLEKGDFYSEKDFNGDELTSTERMFENKGLLTTTDLGILILAGSTLGGGTTINWSASFRTPDYVLQEWEAVYKVSGYTDNTYQEALDAVSERIQVNTECVVNAQNSVLETGAKRLGYTVGTIPRNAVNCQDCGFCNFGCPYGAKQGTMRTYLQDTYDRGGRIIVRAYAERVLVERGRAVGIEGYVIDEQGQRHRLTVRSKVVVAACGALHTPALLMRSGLGNEHIGRNLHLHPTSVTFGIYEEPIRGWQGPIMSRIVHQFKNLDGKGYGVALETAPIHPGIGALSLSWQDGQQHKDIMSKIDHLSNIIIITRDTGSGQIKLSKRGYPLITYQLDDYDAPHLMRGILESIQIHYAAGAKIIGTPFAFPLNWSEGEHFDTYLQEVGRHRLRTNDLVLFSAHQMSSCRMGGSPARGAIDPCGQTYEVQGLYVADASALPTSTGVNPMLTIMAVAYMIAGHIRTAYTP